MEAKKSLFVRIRSKVFCFLPSFEASKARREEYRVAMTKFANKNTNQRFLNGLEWHAEIVVGLMVSRATEKDELLIYCDSLEPRYYAKILHDSKCRIRILLDNVDNSRVLDVIRGLPQDVQNRINFRIAKARYGKHLLTVSNSARCEANDSVNELFMVCNFNEPDAAQRLRDRFEVMWKDSAPCPAY